MDKINIKDLLNQTFVSEAKVPGIDVTKKAKDESGKENKKAIKDMEKELSDYDKDSKKEPKDAQNPVKFNYTDDSEAEYHQEMEIMNGQEMIQYDRKPSEEYKKRAEEAIEGSSRMGNNPEWANVVVPGQGGDPTFGKKLVKAIKASEKKRSDNTPTTKMFGDDWEITQDKSHKDYAFENKQNNKETIKESEKMKKITFKKPFNGVNNAIALIPESYKVNDKTFFITDGNESYKVRWEGSLNEGKAVILMASDATLVNEDVQKMKHLMGYKSEESLGNLKGAERLSEDKKFNDIWNKTKSILTENMDEWTEKQLNAFDNGDHDGTPFEPEDMAALNKENAIGGISKDSERFGTMLDKNSSLTAAFGKINTKQELIDTMSMLYGDILKNNPQLASAEMALITALKEKGRELHSAHQAGAPTGGVGVHETEMAECGTGMYEDGIGEMDRFDEVFSGLDEDMNEGMLSEGIGLRGAIQKVREISRNAIEMLNTNPEARAALLADPNFKKMGSQLSQNINPNELNQIVNNLNSVDSNEENELSQVANSSEGNLQEGIFGGSFKGFAARIAGLIGAPLSAIGVVISIGSTGYNTNWATNPIMSYAHDAIEKSIGTQWGGVLMILCFGLMVANIFFAAINWNAGKK